MEILETIERHPYIAIGGIALAVILLSRGGDSGSSNLAATLESQRIASNTNIALSDINAKAVIARTGYAADMYETGVNAAATLKMSDNAALVDIYTTTVGHNANVMQLMNQYRTEKQAIETSANVALAEIASQADMFKSKLASDEYMHGKAIDVSRYMFDRSAEETRFLAPLAYAHAENIAGIEADTEKTISKNYFNLASDKANMENDRATEENWLESIPVIGDVIGWLF